MQLVFLMVEKQKHREKQRSKDMEKQRSKEEGNAEKKRTRELISKKKLNGKIKKTIPKQTSKNKTR